MQNFSLHTHTKGFDGQDDVEQMVESALKAGLKTLGISNHFIVWPDIRQTKMYAYSVKGGYSGIYSATFDEAIEKFKSNYDKIDQANAKTDITLLKGMEVDFFDTPRWRAGFEKAVDILKPDYIIGSAHFIHTERGLWNCHDMKRASASEQEQGLHTYWQNVRQAAASGYFDFMAHLDLMKKAGLGKDEKWIAQEEKTATCLSDFNVYAEMNTSCYGWAQEAYPSFRIMQMLSKYGVSMLISDDAHKAQDIARNFARAEQDAAVNHVKLLSRPVFKSRHKGGVGSVFCHQR